MDWRIIPLPWQNLSLNYADLNKTTSRPFGATLANPYGILGTPVFGAALVDYTVPDGKVLVITSCNDL